MHCKVVKVLQISIAKLFSKINNELSTAKAILQLSYYEIMDGPDPHVMLTGLFRAGLAVKNLLAFLQFA